MVLSSQMSRSGSGRQYMVSRRRRRHWGRWALVAILLAAGWYYLRSGTESSTPESPGSPEVSPTPSPTVYQASPSLSEPTIEPDRYVEAQPIPTVTVVAPQPVQEKAEIDDEPRQRANAYVDEQASDPQEDRAVQSASTPEPEPETPAVAMAEIISSPPKLSSTVETRTERAPTPTARPEPVVDPVVPLIDNDPNQPSESSQPTSEAEVPAQWSGDPQMLILSEPFAQGMELIKQGSVVTGRRVLSELLLGYETDLSSADAQAIRDTLSQVNESLIFSPRVEPGDTVTEHYTIQSGDLLSKVAPRYNITYQLIEHINNISARRIRVGQQIKVVHGPFHAVVDKSDYRLDLYLPEPDGGMIYIRSFTVGLGENDSTPEGSWVVRRGGKLINPGWTNPRTGRLYAPDDPANPIGDFWIALSGSDAHTQGLVGYGIHGTIEPESIGRSASMGCVRMSDRDIELAYKLLVEGLSTVIIRP